MLAVSALSGLSHSTANSYSQDVDLDLVEEIIDRAPRSATTFPLVYKAYGEVLEENDLSPSSDTIYYQFLLKLGVIRAPTWGERWDLWKATNSIQSRPTHSSPKKSTSGNPRSPRRIAAVRARVPFLASASSDLDEGFVEGSVTDEDGGTYDNDGESEFKLTRPSPRKEIYKDRSRSLVGYTPSQSLDYDYDLVSLIPPVRTSTPIFAQEHHHRHAPEHGYGRSTPPLPPYSVSDASESVSMDHSGPMATGDWRDGSQTPRARSAVLQDDAIDQAVLAEMERRAVEFYETGLRGRCWDVWAQAHDWIQKTTDQIDTVRSNILLRQTLAKWRKVHVRHLQLPDTADNHRDHHLKSLVIGRWIRKLKEADLVRRESDYLVQEAERDRKRTWTKWRNELVKKRTERWTRNMRLREEAFTARRDEGLLGSALHYWRERTQDKLDGAVADKYHFINTKRRIIAFWGARAEQKVTLTRLEASFAARQANNLLLDFLSTWHHRVQLVQAERRTYVKAEGRLLKRVWERWQLEAFRRTSALSLSERHAAVRALRRWRRALTRNHDMQVQASQIALHRDQDLLRSCMTVWVTSERGRLLSSVRDSRRIREAWNGWRKRLESTGRLRDAGDALQQAHLKTIVAVAFSRWRDRHGRAQNRVLQAGLIYDSKRVAGALSTWKAASARNQANAVAADKALTFFAQRTAFRFWKVALGRKRRNEWVENKRIDELRLFFGRWAEATVQSVQDRRSIANFQSRYDKVRLSGVLTRWTERVVEVKSRELEVVERRDTAVVINAFARWRNASKRVHDLKSLMHSFIDVKLEDSLRDVLLHWKRQAVKSHQIRQAAQLKEAERNEKMKREGFEMWYSAFRQRQLQASEEEVSLRREDALAFAVWDKWKSRSTRLRAISKDNERVIQLGWTRWRRATTLGRQAKLAAAASERRLLEDVFAVWKEATKQRTSSRTTRIRGRIRPATQHSIHTPRQVSAPQPDPLRSSRHIVRTYDQDSTTPLARHDGRIANLQARCDDIDHYPESTASEPAYSRLRSELARRRRGASEELEDGREDVRIQGDGGNGNGGSELLKALRGSLENR